MVIFKKPLAVCLALGSMALSTILTTPAASQPWGPSNCDPAVVAELNQRHERLVRRSSARPSLSPPHADPTSDEEVVVNLLTVYANRAHTPAHEARFREALKNHDLTWTVDPVENWTWTRCHSKIRHTRSDLVRAYQGGDEIARFSLWEDGRLAASAFVDPAHPPPEVPTLDAAVREIGRFLGRPLGLETEARYVQSMNHGRCDALAPCVAVSDGTTVYLFQGPPRHDLFAFDATSRRLAWGERPAGLRTIGGPEPGTTNEELFSFGDQWVEARRIELPEDD